MKGIFSESGRGNCLRDPAESITTHDHLGDGRLPGQRFTADQQCSYFWGRDYQVEIPNGRSYEVRVRRSAAEGLPTLGYLSDPVVRQQWVSQEPDSHRCLRAFLCLSFSSPSEEDLNGDFRLLGGKSTESHKLEKNWDGGVSHEKRV